MSGTLTLTVNLAADDLAEPLLVACVHRHAVALVGAVRTLASVIRSDLHLGLEFRCGSYVQYISRCPVQPADSAEILRAMIHDVAGAVESTASERPATG